MMTDKEINTIDSLKANFKSGVRLMPEAFSHLIDEAYKAYEIIDGAQGDGPTAGLKRDDKGKLALNVHHSGGLNLDQGALALSLKPEGGLSFDGGGYLKLDADQQVQFADFFSLSRRERMEITQLLGLKRIVMTRIVSPFPKEGFGRSISINEAGDRLARGTIVYRSSAGKVYVFTRADGGWDMENRIKFLAPKSDAYFFGMSAGLNNVGDRLIVGSSSVVYVYKYINNQWDIGNPIKVLNPSSNSGNSDDYDDFDFVIRNAAGTILAVSATSTKVDSASKAGVIYIFENVN
uniref:hypothetical protein n=1 Tax=Photorhabdus sp. CRCIA-P01 TaxID=2019570 RepID=UPI000E59D6F9|nr:hypothetical protein [Photorhabdus sp. CRCIA-P01]